MRKSPFIVFADAGRDAAAQRHSGQYNNAGQVCLGGTHILVDSVFAEDLVAKLEADGREGSPPPNQ